MVKQIAVEKDHIQVKLTGKMVSADAEALERELLGYIQQGFGTYVIDMSGVTQINSAGLSVLIALNKHAARLGGAVTLKGLQGVVNELFEVTLLKRVFIVQD